MRRLKLIIKYTNNISISKFLLKILYFRWTLVDSDRQNLSFKGFFAAFYFYCYQLLEF